MSTVRTLPETVQQRIERLDRDEWRTQVAQGSAVTAADQGGIVGSGYGDVVTAILERLSDAERRLDILEGVDHSG